MSSMGIFEDIEKKKMRDVLTSLCLWSAELSKAFGLRNLCYSKISVVMLRVQDCWNLAKTRVRTKKMPCSQMLHIYRASVIDAFK